MVEFPGDVRQAAYVATVVDGPPVFIRDIYRRTEVDENSVVVVPDDIITANITVNNVLRV